jgi:flagellar hook protein FlgE
MSVIGNNISNSNTTGYKANRALFSDILAQEVASAGGNSQIGRGVNTATVDTNFSQGTFQGTSSNTDLAIDGPGLFIMGEPGNDTVNYTRDGAFEFNPQGNLVNATGQRVQGYRLNDNENPVGDLTDVHVNTNSSIAAQQTGNIDLSTNLDADASVKAFDVDNPNTSSNFTTSTQIYDSLGQSHTLTTYFNKINDAANEWEYHTAVSVDDLDTNPANTGDTDGDGNPEIGYVAEGSFQFDTNGQFDGFTGSITGTNSGSSFTSVAGGLDWNNGADDTQQVATNLDLTQFSGQSEVVRQEQDGNASGNMVDVSVDAEGNVIANYSNGESEKEFRLGLAQFSNPGGLKREGDNLYSQTDASGDPAIGMPGSSVGTIRSNSLEQSNVDIANQFTKMITTQRAYQANSRTISTTKDMLQEVINLTR